MSSFEVFTVATVVGTFTFKGVNWLISFIKKVNRAEQTRKSLIRLRKTVNDHTTRIITLENRLNN